VVFHVLSNICICPFWRLAPTTEIAISNDAIYHSFLYPYQEEQSKEKYINMKISFHVKTNLTFDGRVLSCVDTISNTFPKADIKISLLPNGSTSVKLPSNVRIDEIIIPLRSSRFKSLFKILIVVWYTLVDLIRTIKFKPDIIHVHDKTAAFAPYLYKALRGKSVKLIYDDHELYHKPETFTDKIFWELECRVARISDTVIVANKSRGKIIQATYKLPIPPTVIENLFYDRTIADPVANATFDETRERLHKLKNGGQKLLLHQGMLTKERGKGLLELIPNYLPKDWTLCVIGVTDNIFQATNLAKYGNVICLGRIDFNLLPELYTMMDGAIIFYLPTYLNNKYCAPNRLYQAIHFDLPLITNSGNPLLSGIVQKHKNGVVLSSAGLKEGLNQYFNKYSALKSTAQTVRGEFDFSISASKYVKVYKSVIDA
jgi:hypothetical protein